MTQFLVFLPAITSIPGGLLEVLSILIAES
uniref:Uncharacterized protein n=1 Tax=Arundo donax TaxID=35708 RepID=A0A0A9CGW0_ARUDO